MACSSTRINSQTRNVELFARRFDHPAIAAFRTTARQQGSRNLRIAAVDEQGTAIAAFIGRYIDQAGPVDPHGLRSRIAHGHPAAANITLCPQAGSGECDGPVRVEDDFTALPGHRTGFEDTIHVDGTAAQRI